MSIAEADEILQLREDLRRIAPPFLLRKYGATEDDYEELADEDLRCELLDGVLIVHSPASLQHEARITFLTTLLNTFAGQRSLGWLWGSNAVMQLGIRRFCPDLSFLAADHAARIQGGRVMGPMDLAIEVISESTRDYDLREKRSAYREGRIPEIWFFDAEKKECHLDFLAGHTYDTQKLTTGRFASRALQGLHIDVTWLWSDPLPNPLECLKSAEAPPADTS